MEGIPPASDTDVEDVVWALQTAEALWKRNERGDAIVWLRRAAQAAGEANDDDRAFSLAREAAELTEWIARSSAANVYSIAPSSEPGSSAGVEIDSLLRSTHVDALESAQQPTPLPPTSGESEATLVPPPDDAPDTEPPPYEGAAAASSRPPVSIRVLSAAESHAGMLDPWSDGDEKMVAQVSREEPPAIASSGSTEERSSSGDESDDEVITSVQSVGPFAETEVALPRSPAPIPYVAATPILSPPPLPPPAPAPTAAKPSPPRIPLKLSAPPRPQTPRPAPGVPSPKPKSAEDGERARAQASPSGVPRAAKTPTRPTKPPPPSLAPAAEAADDTPKTPAVEDDALAPLDLSAVEAFADLPDDAKDSLARAAILRRYAKGESVGPFALAFVVSGDVDVMPSDLSTVATTIEAGRVVRARGSLDEPIPLRLVCASESVVATWTVEAMQVGLGPCPWVEDDLRTSADRIQALAGSTLGVLGQRLSVELRTSIVERLAIRVFAEHEAIVTEGVPVPGLLLVGAGRVNLLPDDAEPTQIGAGQFVLPAEALSAGASPATVRAAQGGALLLIGDRKTTQELFATEPLLLEIFAGW